MDEGAHPLIPSKHVVTINVSDYSSLGIHTQCAWASGCLIPGTTKVNHKQDSWLSKLRNKSQWRTCLSDNTKASRMQTSSTQTSKRSGTYLSHGLAVLLVYHWELSIDATAFYNNKTRSESFKLGMWEEREEETTYGANQSLRQPGPHLVRKNSVTSIHILGRGDRRRLRAFVRLPVA